MLRIIRIARKANAHAFSLKAGHKYRSTSIHTKSRRREGRNSFSLLVGGWRRIREMVLHRNNVGSRRCYSSSPVFCIIISISAHVTRTRDGDGDGDGDAT